MSKEYFFRCKSNPTAPLLKINTAWEAKDMRHHPDYEQVDEFGEVVVVEDEIEGTIPFMGSTGRR
jgi:hypothetical protein